MTRPRPARGLALDLLLRVMLPLLVIIAATAALGAYTTQRQTARAFDGWLLDAARSVAARVRIEHGTAFLDLPPVAQSTPLSDDHDHVYISVEQGGRQVAGSRGIPHTGANESGAGTGATYDTQFDGRPVRVARIGVDAIGAQTVTVLVAQTGWKRSSATDELLAVLGPMLALIVGAGLAIFVAVRGVVRPLQVIASHWNERSHVPLQPIGDDGVPRELLPFTAALNDLLARVRGLLARERQFAATAAHQLRTPLAGLQLGLARAARATDLDEARTVIGELGRTTERTARIVQQLLSLGRIDAATGSEMDFVELDLVALAEDVGARHADQALAQDIDLALAALARPVPARIVPDLIAEALANVLDNALRCTPARGRILVEVHADPAMIRVCDSGPGIPENEQEAVLERFARGRTANGEGSGLGLAIVREIATLHHATLTIGASAWGGACITIVFPALTPAAQAAAIEVAALGRTEC